MYLVNESSKLESVNTVYEIGEKSHSLLDHPRSCIADQCLCFRPMDSTIYILSQSVISIF